MLGGLSLAVGVAVARALQGLSVPGVTLKWPNDVLCHGDKLGGILIEMVGDTAGSCQVIIGIGLNVAMPQQVVGDIDQPWTDIRRVAGNEPGRNVIVGAMLSELMPLLAGFEAGGFAPWREPWMALHAHAGQDLVVTSGERRIAGRAAGIDESGGLILETDLGQQVFHGGEVSVRVAR